MAIPVNRTNIRIHPDYKKVIARFFNTGNERSLLIINKVMQMDDKDAEIVLSNIFKEFSNRYRNIYDIFLKHFALVKDLLPLNEQHAISEKKLLIGAYFTMEYSIEAAALFNPSIVEDPDQGGAGAGQKKVIVSFRATGESHISSLVFKRGLLDENGMIHFEPSGKYISEGIVTQQKNDNKLAFEKLLTQMVLPEDIYPTILKQLQDPFSYKEIEKALKNALLKIESATEKNKIKYDILSMVNTSYEVHFPPESLLSERVIFPVTLTEKNGIEDARFVKFIEDDGSFTYIATYTAYDGSFILPHLITTRDFCDFKVAPLHGRAAINKNLALFPRKINGQYAMISRIDGINNYIMFSDDLYLWEEAILLQQPKLPWELVQIGNAGSPIETEKGWLVITHGVGPMRKYCLGASLFDLDDPTKELGRLNEPLLVPNEEERHGYVPNVVYSCGSIIHGDKLFIPYAVSDHASSFATVPLKELLEEIINSN
ncbi:glycoside hydrolase family 130 protein [Chitinophagaceae bacterium LB-8]|uniref:Glycoside hydrolase family 130 protein n=1 Tax=Paraflavisolibacter caeni TaxID=2982496 RepID=A0A9X2XUG6_9BACT|nr:glycoside hydrolase family 130 protein [Paraflavisolibacter caeni]MCU7549266.1 glycoside hydrolase family 130 protein [Paraflavisolibacter caeni]